jgi:phosphoenolpyruvate synthase/pyruvate phosphate dikinase
MMDYVRRFDEIGAADAGLVGGKGANLGEMTRAGLPVPPGFCVSAGAYYAFTASAHAGKTIRRILAGLQVDDPEDVEVRTEQIRNFLSAQPMPKSIAEEVLKSYYQLGVELGSSAAPTTVAVRSSATDGGLNIASGSEPRGAFLNVRGEADLLEHVKECWALLWTARAATFRVKQGFDHAQFALAVVVQAMVLAEVSGLIFTGSPFTSRRDEVVIIASWGLGEAIVSGFVTPDTFTVRRSDGAILEREIATKDRMIECAIGFGTVEREVPPPRRRLPALSDEQIVQLVSLSKEIEKRCGASLEIDWAYARGRVYVLQTRARSVSRVL